MGNKRRPAMSIEERENEMISLAVDLCEERLRNKTATAQEIIHYLKLATVRNQKEMELLEMEKELKRAKAEALQAAKTSEEKYAKALQAMRSYSGMDLYEAEEENLY